MTWWYCCCLCFHCILLRWGVGKVLYGVFFQGSKQSSSFKSKKSQATQRNSESVSNVRDEFGVENEEPKESLNHSRAQRVGTEGRQRGYPSTAQLALPFQNVDICELKGGKMVLFHQWKYLLFLFNYPLKNGNILLSVEKLTLFLLLSRYDW